MRRQKTESDDMYETENEGGFYERENERREDKLRHRGWLPQGSGANIILREKFSVVRRCNTLPDL